MDPLKPKLTHRDNQDVWRIPPNEPVIFFENVGSTISDDRLQKFEEIYEQLEQEAEEVKVQVVQSLRDLATSSYGDPVDIAEAAYQLCLCHCNSFGVQFDPEESLRWILHSARHGSIKAQAEVRRLFAAFGKEISADQIIEITMWLEAATIAGSNTAAFDLEGWNQAVYNSAITAFRHRFADGGGDFDFWDVDKLVQQIEGLHLNFDDWVINERGYRLLHCAASIGAVEAVELLLNMQANVNVLNNMEETPLLCAFRAGYPTVIKLLLQKGADLNRASKVGETALHWLIGLNPDDANDIVRLLESELPNLPLETMCTQLDDNDYALDVHPLGTPLDWAVHADRFDVVRALLKLGATPFSASKLPAIVRAVSGHKFEIVREFLNYEDVRRRINDFIPPSGTLLFDTIYCETRYRLLVSHGENCDEAAYRTVRLLIQNGARLSEIDGKGYSALQVACAFSDVGMVNFMLDNGGESLLNDECNGITPLYQSMAAGKLDVFKLLISRGARTDALFKHRQTILHFCAHDKQFGLIFATEVGPETLDIEALSIPDGSDEDDSMNYGLTPFQEAVLAANFDVANFYIRDCHANPRTPIGDGWSILAKAIMDSDSRSVEAVKYLVENRLSDFVVKAENRVTALHVAAGLSDIFGDNAINKLKLKYLLQKYSIADCLDWRTCRAAKSVGDQTPLHWAARMGNYFAVWKLLDANASPYPVDDEGNTPLDLARRARRSLQDTGGVYPHKVAIHLKSFEDIIELFEEWDEGGELTPKDVESSVLLDDLQFSRLGFITQ